jgi:hypothetical protein
LAGINIIGFIVCWGMNIRNSDITPANSQGKGIPRKLQRNGNFQEKSPISSRQLVSKLAGAH